MQNSFEVSEGDRRTEMQAWLSRVESLLYAPDWAADELPIELVQTHISAVLLSRRHALKLKKPVDFGFLDYTTLEKRRRACEAEISLNRRLCPDTYLAVQPIAEVNGEIRLSAMGRILDYGVWMRRLPADRMLDRMVKQEVVTEAIIDRVAERLVRFHREARRGLEVDAFGSPEVIRRNWEENFDQTTPFVGRTITSSAFDAIRAWVARRLENSDDLLLRRVRYGHTCDGHGDLRCESICITDGICIYDCIEFNDRFRCGDVVGEVAFLAMDLDARGRPDLGYYFGECYQARTGDRELFTLLPFYRCYRAYVRGKVLSFRLDESEFSVAEKDAASSRAGSYFDLARRYATPLEQPTIIAVAGLSGTGKTSVARAVAGELGLRVVSSDAIRRSLFGNPRRPLGYGEGAYSEDANRRTYQTLFEQGRNIIKEDRAVILDATFQRANDLERAREIVAELGAEWRLIECQLSPELIRSRLERRAALKDGLSDATWETYLRQREQAAPVHGADPATYLALDTSGDLLTKSQAATDWLRANDHR